VSDCYLTPKYPSVMARTNYISTWWCPLCTI